MDDDGWWVRFCRRELRILEYLPPECLILYLKLKHRADFETFRVGLNAPYTWGDVLEDVQRKRTSKSRKVERVTEGRARVIFGHLVKEKLVVKERPNPATGTMVLSLPVARFWKGDQNKATEKPTGKPRRSEQAVSELNQEGASLTRGEHTENPRRSRHHTKRLEVEIKTNKQKPSVELADANPTTAPIEDEPKKKRKAKAGLAVNPSKDVVEVFDYWRKAWKIRSNAALDVERVKSIEIGLDLGFSVEDLKYAIKGGRKDKFFVGQNDRNKPFKSLSVLLRGADRIEGLAELGRDETAPVLHITKPGAVNNGQQPGPRANGKATALDGITAHQRLFGGGDVCDTRPGSTPRAGAVIECKPSQAKALLP